MKFLKKELNEILKTYKIWVVPLIFVFFGFLSPITAKLLPKIVESQMEAQNITMMLPVPSALESFAQYFKNLSQIGALAVILLSMGLVSEEKAKGTLHLILTKPVSRSSVIVSKFLAQSILFVVSVLIGGAVCFLYTYVLFNEGNLGQFSLSIILYIFYYILLIAMTLFFSTLFSNQIASGGVSLIFFFILTILPGVSTLLAKYSPYALTTIADNIVAKGEAFTTGGWPLFVSLVLIAAFLFLSCTIFSHQEL